jgi:hypothetical protein
MELIRNIAFCQFRGSLFLHIGTVAVAVSIPGERSWGLELCTPERWFALRPFRALTIRRNG